MKNKVLLVEDDAQLLALFGEMLQYANYKVLLAGTGHQATEMIETHSSEIILIIVDILMPGMSGHELASWARKHHPHIPCLKISGCFEAPPGARPDQFLEKPFTEKQLLDSVRLAISSIGFRIAM